MALGSQFSLLDSEFNEFLFAAVGEEKNGTQLTILSALTRLDLDPWAEAARLSQLPKEAAARALAATLALLPEENWPALESRTIAVRLVARLPGRSALNPSAITNKSSGNQKAKPAIAIRLSVIFLVAAMFLTVWYFSTAERSEPVPANISSMHR